ncbi:MAG: crossover junction endodeoxyribonuclease RuvC [Acidobacteria bacterium]|nr:crossover junction endodeoxyribonuclease RuvC [Acidobacteriota bacterium]
MRVMGIDPGLARTGWGIVEDEGGRARALASGTVRAREDHDVAGQLLALKGALSGVIAEHRPEAVALERLFFNANVRTALRAGQASGAALLAAAEGRVPVFEYTPSEVKRAVVGAGAATKKQVGYMVSAILGLAERPDSPDAADALALAICHLHGARPRAAIAAALRGGGRR